MPTSVSPSVAEQARVSAPSSDVPSEAERERKLVFEDLMKSVSSDKGQMFPAVREVLASGAPVELIAQFRNYEELISDYYDDLGVLHSLQTDLNEKIRTGSRDVQSSQESFLTLVAQLQERNREIRTVETRLLRQLERFIEQRAQTS